MSSAKKARGFDINERYQKKTDLEHVLLRPDTYVGGIDKVEKEDWILEQPVSSSETSVAQTDALETQSQPQSNHRIVKRRIQYCPALLKIFDEILINARDHTIRDTTCNRIKVTFDQTSGTISVENNGEGIAVEMHEAGCYLPELIFGHFKTGENFSDEEKRTVGGRNGYGSKLSCAFSSRFEVDTVDKHNGLRYVQVWQQNMHERSDPVISKCTKAPYTKITFTPDYKRLGGSQGMEPDFFALATRRVYDLAACTRPDVLIYLNGEKLPVRTFEKYMNLYLGESKTDVPRLFVHLPNEGTSEVEAANGRAGMGAESSRVEGWDLGVALSDDGFKQVSFVNGIATPEGGTHVAYIRDQLVRKLGKIIRDKNTSAAAEVKPEYIRENLWLFVNAVVINPAFSSQIKEQLTTKAENFGFKHSISDDFVQNVEKRLKISKRAMGFAELRKPSILKKTDGKKKKKIHGILKLEDAKHAGGKLSGQCSLIMTEGDSAKTMAMDGLQMIGREFYGVFPLKGKPLSTRNATNDQLATNEEYTAFKKIMGLEEGKEYSDPNELRYGSIILMTDQDVDGYHIKGLKISNILDRWPSLLKLPGFVKCFVTPIVKLEPLSAKSKLKTRLFFNLSEYESFRCSSPDALKGYKKPRYLKGLGTSEKHEALAYFAEFARFLKEYRPRDATLATSLGLFRNAFSDEFADWRKQWLATYDDSLVYDYNQPVFALEDYVDRELKHFSIYANKRSLGCMCDGLKPSQRKVLWAMMEMGLYGEQHNKKVLALSGEISSRSSYHHGEKSLMDTMVGMAQTFVDSNNVNFLYPSGQFGSRLRIGADAADPRYIFTRLTEITKKVFRAEDMNVLKYELNDEGEPIEPQYFAPIAATVLFNGCDGIGTGYSTTVLKYDPRQVIDAHIALLEPNGSSSPPPLHPWYRGFTGRIETSALQEGSYHTYGVFERDSNDPCTIIITELPIGQSFDGYKQFLESHLVANADEKGGGGQRPEKFFIKDYDSATTPSRCHFTVHIASKQIAEAMFENPSGPKGVLKRLKLMSTLSTRNMYLFNEHGHITKYESPEQIISSYHAVRLQLYERRKQHQLEEMRRKISELDRKRRFIQLVLSGDIDVRNKHKREVAGAIRKHNLAEEKEDHPTATPEDLQDDNHILTPSMKTLLSVKLYDMTQEEVDKFLTKMRQLEQECKDLEAMSASSIWLKELLELRMEMDQFLRDEVKELPKAKVVKKSKK
jgi:DNA topoisomerase-2